MLKKIKTKKQMRLDELIKYVWDSGITNEYFYAGFDKSLLVNELGKIEPKAHFSAGDVFTVEIEEPITKNTVFDNLIEVTKNDNALHYYRTNISDVATNRSSKRFYALISGKLELVWEREEE